MNRRKQCLFNDIVIGIAVFAGLWVIGELGLRWYVGVYRQPLLSEYKTSDRDLGWALKPGYTSNTVNINTQGFRGKEFHVTKAAGNFRIAFLGNSCVFGSGVNDDETLPLLLEQCLQTKGYSVEILNTGVPGYASSHVRTQLKRDVLKLHPDLVLLYAGWNDYFSFYPGDPQYQRPQHDTFNKVLEQSYVLKLGVKIAFQKVKPYLDSLHKEKLDLYSTYRPAQFIENYKDLVHVLRTHHVEFLALTLPSLLGDKNISMYQSKVLYPFFTSDLEAMTILWNVYNSQIKSAAKPDVFDLAHAMHMHHESGKLFQDTHHTNGDGNRILARILCDYLLTSWKLAERI